MSYNKYLSILSVSALLIATQAFAATPDPVMPAASGSTTTTASSNAASIALNVPGTPTLTSKTATTVTLEWAKVDTAKSYIVKYSETSVAQAFEAGNKNATYSLESDQVTSTGITIKDLKTDKNYYFAVVALDAAMNESMTNSGELMVALSSATSTGALVKPLVSDFKLTAVTVINAQTLSIDFSAALSSDPVTLKIEKSTDKSSIFVKNVVPGKSSNQVIVNLVGSLDPSSSYSLVIVTAKDSKWAPISQGLNALKEFATSATLAKAVTATSLLPLPTSSGASMLTGGLNAAPPEGSWALAASGALPATGTQETLLLVLAAVLSLAIVFIFRNKKA